MKRLILTALFCLPLQAHALLITSSAGDTYDVSTITGTWNDLQTDLLATPWWGDGLLATELSGLFPNANFVFEAGQSTGFDFLTWGIDSGMFGCSSPTCWETSYTWAVGTEVVESVPEPGTLGLLGTALIVLGLVRRRKAA